MRFWTVIVLCTAAASGCGSMAQTHIDDAKLVQASAGDRQRLLALERRSDVAEQNAGNAHTAVGEARKFSEVARLELDGARAQLDAAQKARELAATARDPSLRGAAEEHELTSRRKLGATQALVRYADKLVTAREERAHVADAAVALTRADQEALKAQIISNGQATELARRADLERDQALDRLQQARLRAQEEQTQAQALRDLWMERRSALTASRAIELAPFEAPPPPARVPVPDVP